MSTNTTTNARRLGSRGNAETKSDIEIWANYLVVATLETDAKTMIAEQEPSLWQVAMRLLDRKETEGVAMVIALDALLATPDAAPTMVRQIRDALFLEISQQCHEQLDPRVRALMRTLHE